jgi:hypothetical protein
MIVAAMNMMGRIVMIEAACEASQSATCMIKRPTGWLTHVEPGSQHPCPVLFDLEPFDVHVCQAERHQEQNRHEACPDSHRQTSSHRVRGDYEHANNAHHRQQDQQIPIDPVEQYELVPDHRDELQDDQDSRRQDTGKVKYHARAVKGRPLEVVALPRGGAVRGAESRPAEHAVDVEVHEAGEGEAKHTAGKQDEEDEVVASVEAEGVVDAPGCCHERVGRRLRGIGHCDVEQKEQRR